MEKWAAEIIAKLKMNRITQRELAAQMGIRAEYLSSILNGKRKIPGDMEERINKAIAELIKE